MSDLKLTPASLGHVVKCFTELTMGNPGKAYRVPIPKEWREKRSLSQNNMYWAWLEEISQQCNLESDASNAKSKDLWHEILKHYYCPMKIVKNENASMHIKSTSLLDVGEMTYYLNKIESWCLDRGIKLTIPESSEYYKLMQRQVE